MTQPWCEQHADALCRLTSRLCDDALSDDEFAQLHNWLAESPAARRRYYAALLLHGELVWSNAAQHSLDNLMRLDPRMQLLEASATPAPDAPAVPWPRRVWRTMNEPAVFSYLVAALFLIGALATLGLLRLSQGTLLTSPDDAPLATAMQVPLGPATARIERLIGVEWEAGAATWRDGDLLRIGHELQVKTGIAQLYFDGGASVLLQGPARFTVQGSLRGELDAGRLTAHVEPAAHGFIVDLPQARVVDLGTEFGLQADPLESEIHVFQGSVRVEPVGMRASHLLRAGEALLLAWSGSVKDPPRVSRVEATPASFTRVEEVAEEAPEAYPQAVLASKPLAYYRLNETYGPLVKDHSGNRRHAKAEDKVVLGEAGPLSRTHPGLSRYNRAADFRGGRIVAELPLGASYSVEMWVYNRLPHDARPVTGYFFSRAPGPAPNGPGDHLGVSGSFETPGMPIFYIGEQTKALSNRDAPTIMPLQAWRHLALVRDGDRAALYINGEEEFNGEMKANIPPTVQGVYFGGRADNFSNLSGLIDEVSFYDRPLSVDEIVRHYRAATGDASADSSPTQD